MDLLGVIPGGTCGETPALEDQQESLESFLEKFSNKLLRRYLNMWSNTWRNQSREIPTKISEKVPGEIYEFQEINPRGISERMPELAPSEEIHSYRKKISKKIIELFPNKVLMRRNVDVISIYAFYIF